MIVGIIALITALFFGGPGEIFYVDDLEKGIKKNILDKERKKEILADFKITKEVIKDYEKQRKKDFKVFKNIYSSFNTTNTDLESFFNNLLAARNKYQNTIIDKRILIFEKIEDQEWSNILESSITASQKRIEKLEKKASKGKDRFEKTKASVNNSNISKDQKDLIQEGLEEVGYTAAQLEKTLLSINPNSDKILANKHSKKDKLLELVKKDSQTRSEFINAVINFHQIVKNNSNEDGFNDIIKAFLKEVNMSSK
ncbi:hypothetical protein [Cognatitamlana onchidii]|uniref:hypothetical protein n=1 Tax=Cognatitamlana onchidii TaxID=2562860 RepID=UPI0010A63FAB|nr:hypothetical protein [Algibacter onchidii]